MESTLLSYQYNTALRATYKVGSVRPQTLFSSCKEIWIPGSSGIFVLVESGILVFGIRNTAQGIQNPTNDWNSESKSHWQGLKFSISNPEYGIQSLSWIPHEVTLFENPKPRPSFVSPRDWAPHPNPCFHKNRWTPQPGWSLLSEVFHLIHDTCHLTRS